MPALRFEARNLPEAPLDASSRFATEILPQVRETSGDRVVVFDPADHTHHAWRTAMVQEVAREAAPARVNGIVSRNEGSIATLMTYLDAAPGVTGQIFTTNDAECQS